MALQQYNWNPTLTPVRVASTANLADTYYNGPLNNGVGATVTVTAAGALAVDGVNLNVGDSVLLAAQTNTNENGIYIVVNAGATGVQPVLQRRADFQSIEQMKAGQYVTIGAGTANAGLQYVLTEPLPAQLGIGGISVKPTMASAEAVAAAKQQDELAKKKAEEDAPKVAKPADSKHAEAKAAPHGHGHDAGKHGS